MNKQTKEIYKSRKVSPIGYIFHHLAYQIPHLGKYRIGNRARERKKSPIPYFIGSWHLQIGIFYSVIHLSSSCLSCLKLYHKNTTSQIVENISDFILAAPATWVNMDQWQEAAIRLQVGLFVVRRGKLGKVRGQGAARAQSPLEWPKHGGSWGSKSYLYSPSLALPPIFDSHRFFFWFFWSFM